MNRWVGLGLVIFLIAIAIVLTWKLPQDHKMSLQPQGPSSEEESPPSVEEPVPENPPSESSNPGVEEIELLFRSGDLQLAGTLTLPAERSTPVPAVLFISDAGTVDRNGNGLGINVDFFKVLAAKLAALGIGSFRYDKRGVGNSEGKVYKASLNDLVTDAVEALRVLRDREEIDLKRLFILGHGEGAEIAALVASTEPDIRGLILVAGSARSLDQIRLDRIRLYGKLLHWSKKRLEEQLSHERDFIAFVKQSRGEWEGYSFQQMKEILPWLDYQQFLVFKVFALSWYREHFRHQPADTIRQLRVPLLIIQGGKDHLTPTEEAERLAQAAKEGGNTDVQVQILPDLNHLIRPSQKLSLNDFHLEEPVDGRVLHLIGQWISEKLN